jgi:hypothetical protein
MGRRMENHGKSMKSGCFHHFCADNGHFWAMLWESDYKSVDGMQFLDQF